MSRELILVVDDEKKIAQVLKAYLEQEGFRTELAFDGEEALQKARDLCPDLILLDLMLPVISGEDVARILRGESEVPIVMVTAKSEEEDRIRGLMGGADDYVVKPFSPREVVARVKAVLRRTRAPQNQNEEETLAFDGERLVIDIPRHEVAVEGKTVSLTPTEFKLLSTLARSPGRVYTRSQLTEIVQGYDYEGYDRTIDVHIKNLRQKIEQAPDQPRYIKTVYGVGYKFGGDKS